MTKRWLILDCDYLCNRAFYSMPPLDQHGEPTEVIYGFFRELVNLQTAHETHDIIFCFDYGVSWRKKILPSYKEARKQRYDGRDRARLRQQIAYLRDDILEQIGFRNVFYEEGFEADDVIASVCKNSLNEEGDGRIIVSSDEDLYQLLDEWTWMWKPGKAGYNLRMFEDQYWISPSKWPEVKSIAGCRSDGIPGVPGVGQRTAVKYLAGTLGNSTVLHRRIEKNKTLINRNRHLVTLPLEGTPIFLIRQDQATHLKWRSVLSSLGIDPNDSLLRRFHCGQKV